MKKIKILSLLFAVIIISAINFTQHFDSKGQITLKSLMNSMSANAEDNGADGSLDVEQKGTEKICFTERIFVQTAPDGSGYWTNIEICRDFPNYELVCKYGGDDCWV